MVRDKESKLMRIGPVSVLIVTATPPFSPRVQKIEHLQIDVSSSISMALYFLYDSTRKVSAIGVYLSTLSRKAMPKP